MASDNGLQPTSAADWKRPREEGVVVSLPYSGHNIRLRPVAIDVLVTTGKIPDILSSIAMSVLFEETTVESILQDPAQLKNWGEILNIVIPAAVMEPSVAMPGEEPTAEQITIDDIDYLDKMFIFNYATSGARALYLFRDQQGTDGKALSNRNQNGNKTKRSARTRK